MSDNVVTLTKKNSPADDAVIAHNLGKLRRAEGDFQEAKNDYQSIVKNVQAKGINLKAAKWAIKMQKSGKIEAALEEMQARFAYAFILGSPISKAQLDLFRVEAPRTPSVDKAAAHGRYCGLMGLGPDQSPHSEDTDAGQAWLKAYHGGLEERSLVMQMESSDEIIAGGEDEDLIDDEDEASEA